MNRYQSASSLLCEVIAKVCSGPKRRTVEEGVEYTKAVHWEGLLQGRLESFELHTERP